MQLMLLLLLLSFTTPSNGHNDDDAAFCGSAKLPKATGIAPQEYEQAPGNQRRLSHDNAGFAPIRITLDYSLVNIDSSIEPSTLSLLKQATSAAATYLSQFFSIRRVSKPLSFPYSCSNTVVRNVTQFGNVTRCASQVAPPTCFGLPMPPGTYSESLRYHQNGSFQSYIPIGGGVEDSDLIVFVLFNETSLFGVCNAPSPLAAAGPCFFDQNGRPIAGAVIVCPLTFERVPEYTSQVLVMAHEMTHVLGLPALLGSSFRNQPVLTSATYYDGTSAVFFNGSRTADFARKHHDCPHMPGALLENVGGAGTAGGHWDLRHWVGDYMVGFLSPSVQFPTRVTLSFFADSGLYKVDFSYAQPLLFGKGEGCQFLNGFCIDKTILKSNFDDFCVPDLVSSGNTCDQYHTAVANCRARAVTVANIPPLYRYFAPNMSNPNITLTGSPSADFCPFMQAHLFQQANSQTNRFSRCIDTTQNDPLAPSINKQGQTSRCAKLVDQAGTKEAACVETRCRHYSKKTKKWNAVEYRSGYDKVKCRRKDVGKVKSFAGGYNVICPRVDWICRDGVSRPLTCGNGFFNDDVGECRCEMGMIGKYCQTEDRRVLPAPKIAPVFQLPENLCLAHANSYLNGNWTVTNLVSSQLFSVFSHSYRSETYFLLFDPFHGTWAIRTRSQLVLPNLTSATGYCNLDLLQQVVSCGQQVTRCNGHWIFNAPVGQGLDENAQFSLGACSTQPQKKQSRDRRRRKWKSKSSDDSS